MRETKYSSYLSGKLVKGCELCVKGRKMVLFVTGLCSRGCEFCPLSKMRKSVDKIYANERLISTEDAINEIIEEVKISGAKGCSLTGGDPLLKFDRTIKLASGLKKEFGKKFHI
ncbi:MAG: 4Fe-4S cluster-binding domain-containing protein, partial [Bacteroidales bacterium]|nr:4Fe-4S cluster-binding domain-containing protein [Bacteroidales bacterium]